VRGRSRRPAGRKAILPVEFSAAMSHFLASPCPYE
jgi:hypothetical protein